MRTRLALATALLMSIGLTATACSGGSSADTGGSTTAGAVQNSGGSGSGSGGSGGSSANGTKADPCTLVTAGQLQAAAGVALSKGSKGQSVNSTVCEWKTADGAHSVTIGVFTDPVTPSDFATETSNPVVTKVSGWTYPAYIETDNNTLHAQKDNTEILVMVVDESGTTSDAKILAREETLATAAFAKI